MSIEDMIAEMRKRLRCTLPERAFLRRDRGEGLFISNAPVFAPDLMEIPGFRLERDGGLLRILPEACWIARLEEEYAAAPDFFCETLARFKGQTPARENIILFARGIKALDAGVSASAEEKKAYDRELRQRCAVALRGGCGGGGLYAAAIVNSKIKSI